MSEKNSMLLSLTEREIPSDTKGINDTLKNNIIALCVHTMNFGDMKNVRTLLSAVAVCIRTESKNKNKMRKSVATLIHHCTETNLKECF